MNLGIQTAKSYFSNGKLYFNGKTQIGVCKNGLVLKVKRPPLALAGPSDNFVNCFTFYSISIPRP